MPALSKYLAISIIALEPSKHELRHRHAAASARVNDHSQLFRRDRAYSGGLWVHSCRRQSDFQ